VHTTSNTIGLKGIRHLLPPLRGGKFRGSDQLVVLRVDVRAGAPPHRAQGAAGHELVAGPRLHGGRGTRCLRFERRGFSEMIEASRREANALRLTAVCTTS